MRLTKKGRKRERLWKEIDEQVELLKLQIDKLKALSEQLERLENGE